MAINYNSRATMTALCVYRRPGCTDSNAINYLVLANIEDGSCEYSGCCDSEATNFDDTATFNDGLCAPHFLGCVDEAAENHNNVYTKDDGSCSCAAGLHRRVLRQPSPLPVCMHLTPPYVRASPLQVRGLHRRLEGQLQREGHLR